MSSIQSSCQQNLRSSLLHLTETQCSECMQSLFNLIDEIIDKGDESLQKEFISSCDGVVSTDVFKILFERVSSVFLHDSKKETVLSDSKIANIISFSLDFISTNRFEVFALTIETRFNFASFFKIILDLNSYVVFTKSVCFLAVLVYITPSFVSSNLNIILKFCQSVILFIPECNDHERCTLYELVRILIGRLYSIFPSKTLSFFKTCITNPTAYKNDYVDNGDDSTVDCHFRSFINQTFSNLSLHPGLLLDPSLETSEDRFDGQCDKHLKVVLIDYGVTVNGATPISSEINGHSQMTSYLFCDNCQKSIQNKDKFNGQFNGKLFSGDHSLDVNGFKDHVNNVDEANNELSASQKEHKLLLALEKSRSSLLLSQKKDLMEELSTTRRELIEAEKESVGQKLVAEAQQTENKKLMKVIFDLNSKLNAMKSKNEEFCDNIMQAEQSCNEFETLLNRTKEELNMEKKRNSSLATENERIKSKLFEYSEIKNKLTRKVDSQSVYEHQLQNLSKELLLMREIHMMYEDKINKLNYDLRACAENQLVTACNRRETTDLRQKTQKITAQMKDMELKLSENETKLKVEAEKWALKETMLSEKIAATTHELDLFRSEAASLHRKLSEKEFQLSVLNSELKIKQLKQGKSTQEKRVGTQ